MFMSRVSKPKNAVPTPAEWLNLLHRLKPGLEQENAARAADARSAQGAVPVAPGTFYEPVSDFDRAVVNTNPVARHMIAGSVAAKDAMAAYAAVAQGNFMGAAAATQGMWQAWAGVVAPF
jgi:hypothetical protein